MASDAAQFWRFCCALWVLWSTRNKWVHSKIAQSSIEVVRFIQKYLEEVDDIKSKQTTNLSVSSSWKSPCSPYIKFNFDAAFQSSNHTAAVGVIGRNAMGRVLVSKSKAISNVASSFAVEAYACKEAVELGLYLSLPKVIIEGDALSIIKKYNNLCLDRSEIGPILQDVRKKKEEFQEISSKHISRSRNLIAHLLASECLKKGEEVYMLNAVPAFVQTTVTDESVREPD